jgi:hypothetical protein
MRRRPTYRCSPVRRLLPGTVPGAAFDVPPGVDFPPAARRTTPSSRRCQPGSSRRDTRPSSLPRRYASDPSAENDMTHYCTPRGDLRIPVLTLHTTRDPIAPIFHEQLFAQAVQGAGASAYLLQRTVDAFGHCGSPAAESAGFAGSFGGFAPGTNRRTDSSEPRDRARRPADFRQADEGPPAGIPVTCAGRPDALHGVWLRRWPALCTRRSRGDVSCRHSPRPRVQHPAFCRTGRPRPASDRILQGMPGALSLVSQPGEPVARSGGDARSRTVCLVRELHGRLPGGSLSGRHGSAPLRAMQVVRGRVSGGRAAGGRPVDER